MVSLYALFLGFVLWFLVNDNSFYLFGPIVLLGGIFYLSYFFKRRLNQFKYFFNKIKQRKTQKVGGFFIDFLVNAKMGTLKQVKYERFFNDNYKMGAIAAEFLLNKKIDENLMLNLSIDCSDLILLQEIESAITIKDYNKSIALLKTLVKKYRMNKWIYDRLFLSYESLGDLDSLKEIATKFGDKKEQFKVDLIRLKKMLELAHDVKEKRTILEKIYTLEPSNETSTIAYFKLLQSIGEYDLVLRLIKNSWRSISSIPIARIALDILLSPELMLKIKLTDFVESLPEVNTYGSSLLKIYYNYMKGEIILAESTAIEVMKYNELVSYIFQLELANLSKNTKLMNSALNGILSAPLPEGR